jgi:hypothetical protein
LYFGIVFFCPAILYVFYDLSGGDSKIADILMGVLEIVVVLSFIPVVLWWGRMKRKEGTLFSPHKYIYGMAFLMSQLGHFKEFLELCEWEDKFLQVTIMAEIMFSFAFFLVAGLMQRVQDEANTKFINDWKEIRHFCLAMTAMVNLAWFIREFFYEHDYGFEPPMSEIIVTAVIDFRLQTLFCALKQIATEITLERQKLLEQPEQPAQPAQLDVDQSS